MRFLFVTAFMCLSVMSYHDVRAEYSPKTVKIIASTLDFVNTFKGHQDIKVVILYDPHIASSSSETEKLKDIFPTTTTRTHRKITTTSLAVDALSKEADLVGINVFYIATGMDAHSSKIYEIAKAKQILTISGDKKCALETCCALVIHDSGSIEILLNESTLKQLGIEMDAAYRLMAKRV